MEVEGLVCPPSMTKDGTHTCNYDSCKAYLSDLYFTKQSGTCDANACDCNKIATEFAKDINNAHNFDYGNTYTDDEKKRFQKINTKLGACSGGSQQDEACYATTDRNDVLNRCNDTVAKTNYTCNTLWYQPKCTTDQTCKNDSQCPPLSTCLDGKCAAMDTTLSGTFIAPEWLCDGSQQSDKKSLVDRLSQDSHMYCNFNWKKLMTRKTNISDAEKVCSIRYTCDDGSLCDPKSPVAIRAARQRAKTIAIVRATRIAWANLERNCAWQKPMHLDTRQ